MLIGPEVRFRSNADKIRSAMSGCCESYVIDFEGVAFVSRSFADELCNIMDENQKIRLINESPSVKKMIDTVLSGRKRIRQRNNDDDSLVSVSSLDELSELLKSM